jgi:hypothetical protein
MALGRLEDATSREVSLDHTRDRKTGLSRTIHFQSVKSVLIFESKNVVIEGLARQAPSQRSGFIRTKTYRKSRIGQDSGNIRQPVLS